MYKTETHVHTSPASICARISPRDVVRMHKEAGYDTIIIANHFDKAHLGRLGKGLPWEQKVELHFQAYEEARAAGEELGLNVLWSAEITLEKLHYLVYGTTKEMLMAHPEILDWTIAEFSAFAKENGLFIVQAHPLREDTNKPHPYPEYVDGFEVINSSPRYDNRNDEVYALAKEHHLLMTVGSDVHLEEDIGGTAVLSDREVTTVEEYLELIKSGEAKLMRWGEIV